jgi:hypothetical protein
LALRARRACERLGAITLNAAITRKKSIN